MLSWLYGISTWGMGASHEYSSFSAEPFRPVASLASAAQQCLANERKPIVAEVHVVAVDEHGRRAEAAAADQFVGAGLELVLDLLPCDAGKERPRRHPGAFGRLCQNRIVRYIPVIPPVGLEHRLRERHQLSLRLQQDAAAHGLDAVDREHGRREPDGETGVPRPILHVLQLISLLRRHRVFARGVDARVDAVENAANQDRAPANGHAQFGGQRLDVVKPEVGPGARAVEKEFDHREASGASQFRLCAPSRTLCAVWPNKALRASSSIFGNRNSLPRSSPRFAAGRSNSVLYQRLTCGNSASSICCALWVRIQGKIAMSAIVYSPPAT